MKKLEFFLLLEVILQEEAMKKNAFLLAIFVCCSLAYADTLTGLIASYQLNNSGSDSSGNGNTATNYTTTGTTDRFGNANSAMYFDGNDYLATPLYRSNYNYLTVTMWFRYTGGAADTYRTIVGSSNGDFFIGKNSGNTSFGVQDQSNYYNPNMAVGTNAWDGNWHFAAYTYNNGTGILYMDGVKYTTDSFIKGGGQILIGLESTSQSFYFVGAIDDVRFYNRVLTTTDITEVSMSVPEPSTLFLGLVALGWGIWRRKR